MKKFVVFLTIIAMLVSSLMFVGCANQVNLDSENSYVISIYKEELKQKENGEVVSKGLKLVKSFQVAKSQLFDLEYETYEKDGEEYEGKISYYGLDYDYISKESKKIYILPSDDTTIIKRVRELKDIKIMYNGQEISSYLEVDDRDVYNEYFKQTYEESFIISTNYVNQILSNIDRDVTIEFYTNPDFTGEPFLEQEFTYSSYYDALSVSSLRFALIKSTTVYVKVV